MIKAVIFDYGGVLKESQMLSKDMPEMFNVSAEEIAEKKPKTKPIFSLFNKGLISEQEFWQKFSEALGKPLPENHEKIYRDIYKKGYKLFVEMFDFSRDLRKKGIKTAILSNIAIFQAEVIREEGGYKDFDVIILSYEEGLEKPHDLDFYHLAPKRLGVKPEECIFIDDKQENLPPAQSIGMKTILFVTPQQAKEEVLKIIEKEK